MQAGQGMGNTSHLTRPTYGDRNYDNDYSLPYCPTLMVPVPLHFPRTYHTPTWSILL